MATERIIAAEAVRPDEEQANWSLRPTSIKEYVGQSELIERISIAIQAGVGRGEPLEHVLLHGPPGLGKTTLAHVIAREMGTRLHTTSGPALARGTDLVAALTRLERGDILFIDEIHRLPIAVEEFIYPAMEDYRIDVCVDSGLHARTVQIDCQPFTLIGATTRAGLLSAPLRSRFGITHHLRYYAPQEVEEILRRSCGLLEMGDVPPEALSSIAGRSRGTPRIANRLLRRVRDFAQVRADGRIDQDVAQAALRMLDVDEYGLDEMDARVLKTLIEKFEGGPVGLNSLAVAMGEDATTLEEVYEPFLIMEGFLARTPQGRVATPRAFRRFGYALPERQDQGPQGSLFVQE